jgi:hypothetical protein
MTLKRAYKRSNRGKNAIMKKINIRNFPKSMPLKISGVVINIRMGQALISLSKANTVGIVNKVGIFEAVHSIPTCNILC